MAISINSTIKWTIFLLLIMSGVGTASAYLAYQTGREALQGVNQPTSNPAKKLTKVKKSSTQPTEFEPIDEKTILIKVYDHIHAEEKKSDSKSSSEKAKDKKSQETSQNKPDSSESKTVSVGNLPLKVQDGGVMLEVTESNNQGGNVLLNVNLKNQGNQTVKFLYSFLEVKDNQGRSLSAITEGLPDELPANNERFTGTIKIPSALMNEVESLSINLTDYPDQKLNLKLAKIPVIR